MSGTRAAGLRNTLLASFLLSWAPILGKVAYAARVTPGTVVALRTLIAAAFLWAVFLLWQRKTIFIGWRNLLGCIAVGAVNGLGSLLYYSGLSRLDASLASLLNTLYALWVVIFLSASGQPMARLTLVRLALAMAGVLLLTNAGAGQLDWLGVMLMVASAATYGWHLVLGQWVLADAPSEPATLYIITTMAAVVGLARLGANAALESISVAGWGAVLALGITTALSRLAMFKGLQKLGGIQTALISLLELLVTLLLAFLLLGERLSLLQWIGGSILVASVLLAGNDASLRQIDPGFVFDPEIQS